MPGPVPGTHILRAAWQGVDGRDKAGHDEAEAPACGTLLRGQALLDMRSLQGKLAENCRKSEPEPLLIR